MSRPFSDRETALIKELWDAGEMTGTEIGQRLGRSKNSVIAKAGRLGLKQRGSPIKRMTEQEKIESRKRQRLRAHPDEVTDPLVKYILLYPEFGNSMTTSLIGMDCGNMLVRHCRFIEGNVRGKDWSFCGEPTIEGYSYCGEHLGRCYKTLPRHLEHYIQAADAAKRERSVPDHSGPPAREDPRKGQNGGL